MPTDIRRSSWLNSFFFCHQPLPQTEVLWFCPTFFCLTFFLWRPLPIGNFLAFHDIDCHSLRGFLFGQNNEYLVSPCFNFAKKYVQSIEVNLEQCCPRVAASPYRPSSPITQLSPSITPRLGTMQWIGEIVFGSMELSIALKSQFVIMKLRYGQANPDIPPKWVAGGAGEWPMIMAVCYWPFLSLFLRFHPSPLFSKFGWGVHKIFLYLTLMMLGLIEVATRLLKSYAKVTCESLQNF